MLSMTTRFGKCAVRNAALCCTPFLALLITETFNTGCVSCNMMGCENGFHLQMLNPDGTPVQNFSISFTFDGGARTLYCGPMFETNDHGGTGVPDAGERPPDTGTVESPDAGSPDAQDAGSAGRLSGSCWDDGQVFIATDASEVEMPVLTVYDDPPATWSEILILPFEDVYLDGEECGVYCRQAQIKVTRKY